MILYEKIARMLSALEHCSNEWAEKHYDCLHNIEKEYLPSGSGFDVGTNIVFEESNADKIVFCSSFHEMNETGCYVRWIDFDIIIVPSFIHGFDINIKMASDQHNFGLDEYIEDTFVHCLNKEIE